MLKKVKVIISRENGSPITDGVPEPYPVFLTDASPVLVVRKNGGTVETLCGDIYALVEFTIRQLEELGDKDRKELCKSFGLTLQRGRQ